jgi:hypothetical protein
VVKGAGGRRSKKQLDDHDFSPFVFFVWEHVLSIWF